MAYFVVEDRGGIREFLIQRLTTIGRSPNNDLVLMAVFASRRHAWVWRQGDQYILEDLGSTHGTHVNGERITGPRFLHDRDVITMGDARLTFVTAAEWSSDQTPPMGTPRITSGSISCDACGAANPPEARFCGRCGRGLWPGVIEFRQVRPEARTRGSSRLAFMEPVVARPFQAPRPLSPSVNRQSWMLIALLVILAWTLLTAVGMLIAYVVG